MDELTTWREIAKAVREVLKEMGKFRSQKNRKAVSGKDNETYFTHLKEAREALGRLRDGLETGDRPVQQFSANQLGGLLNGLTANVLALSRRSLGDGPDPELRANMMVFEADGSGQQGKLFIWLSTDVQSYESLYKPWEWGEGDLNARSDNPGICVRAFLSQEIVLMPDMTGQEQRRGESIAGMIALPIASPHSCQHGDFAVINLVSSKLGIIPAALTSQQRERMEQVRIISDGVSRLRRFTRMLIEQPGPDDTLSGTDTEQGFQADSLLLEAETARARAHAPYSKFKVGAALLCANGTVVHGCNIENASFGATNCAERVAVQTAVSRGLKHFSAIAVVGPTGKPIMPCGICRQVLSEFSENGAMQVIVRNGEGKTAQFFLSELLPHKFSQDDLKRNKNSV